jgi:hypothetical protein
LNVLDVIVQRNFCIFSEKKVANVWDNESREMDVGMDEVAFLWRRLFMVFQRFLGLSRLVAMRVEL